jgi:hypothetical protein
VACTSFMWPRLLDPHFGLLDDGMILQAAQVIAERPGTAFTVGTDHGRFSPAFWLFYTGVYSVVGQNPAGFFAANLFILIGLTAALAFTVRAGGGSDLQAMLAAVGFLIGAPAVEAFYTLSKPEPLQALLLVMAIYLAMRGAQARSKTRRRVSGVGAVVLLAAASFLKETTLIVLPIVVMWALASRFARSWVEPERRQALVVLLVAGAVAATVFVATRTLVLPVGQLSGSYASNFVLTPARIGVSAARWAGWLVHDYFHLLVLALFVAPAIRGASGRERELLMGSTIWMGAWVAMYLPWHSLAQYYLLPFSLGAAVFTAVAVSVLVARARGSERPGLRGLAYLGLVISAGVLAANLVNNRTRAAIQLVVDRTNASLIDYLASLPVGTTVFVNVDEPNEYEFEIGVHLAVLRARGDMHVDYFRPSHAESLSDCRGNCVVATPLLANQIAPSVRMAVVEGDIVQRQKLLEGVDRQRGVWSIQSVVQVVDIDFRGLLTFLPRGPLAQFDGRLAAHRFVDRQRFTYGWRVATNEP